MMQAAEEDAGDVNERAEDARLAEKVRFERAERKRLEKEALEAEIARQKAEEARLKAEREAEVRSQQTHRVAIWRRLHHRQCTLVCLHMQTILCLLICLETPHYKRSPRNHRRRASRRNGS